jgi:hypothetical protein
MLPQDFPYRFFNPLTSKHREDYIHILLLVEVILEQAKRIALPRNALSAEIRRTLHRENYALDVSDEEEYDGEPSGDPERDNLAFTLRMLLRSGWIDVDESGDYASDLVFITVYGKKLTGFLKDLAKMEDQSGNVVNTYSNLQQVRTMPENGLICIQNAYESTQKLLTNLEMMYSKIKKYYSAVLENTKPEELLAGHLYGYVRDVVDKLIFPIKVDDSVDRFKGPILNVVLDIESDTALLEKIISAAVQTKRIASKEDGWAQILKMLNYIKYNFDDIESYIQQLDEKNQTYIRITRQKLTYMLSMDTSIRGDIVAILRDAKKRPEEDWNRLNECINLLDLRQVMDGSFYRPRKRHVRNGYEELGIEEDNDAHQEEVDAVIDTKASQFTGAKVNEYARSLLSVRDSVDAKNIALQGDDDYLMAIFLALNSTDRRSPYSYEAADGMVTKGRYGIPDFTLKRKGATRNEN